MEVNAAAYLEFPKDTVTRKPTTGIAGRACNMGPDSRYAAENEYQRATIQPSRDRLSRVLTTRT